MFLSSSNDYANVEQALQYIRQNPNSEPKLDAVARAVALSPREFESLFVRWAGVRPNKFLGFFWCNSGNGLVAPMSAPDPNRSSCSRNLTINFEVITRGQHKNEGSELDVRYGIHSGRFGDFIIVVTEGAISALEFFGSEGPDAVLASTCRRFSQGQFRADQTFTRSFGELAFEPHDCITKEPLRLWCRGTPFQITVWKVLLSTVCGQLATYGQIARTIGQPAAARAVGGAVGRNPIGFLIPCHRVVRASNLLDTQYRWGPSRKLAIIGWEYAQVRHDDS
ncbi:MAG: methylated-DNA--[protein]-cysteine S-methyltransferase [Pseudomonadota bacterium]|nr:methylated-DNA--[protein]-cysteine S-methyltransferase [Pseudomonadota bacterium]